MASGRGLPWGGGRDRHCLAVTALPGQQPWLSRGLKCEAGGGEGCIGSMWIWRRPLPAGSHSGWGAHEDLMVEAWGKPTWSLEPPRWCKWKPKKKKRHWGFVETGIHCSWENSGECYGSREGFFPLLKGTVNLAGAGCLTLSLLGKQRNWKLGNAIKTLGREC